MVLPPPLLPLPSRSCGPEVNTRVCVCVPMCMLSLCLTAWGWPGTGGADSMARVNAFVTSWDDNIVAALARLLAQSPRTPWCAPFPTTTPLPNPHTLALHLAALFVAMGTRPHSLLRSGKGWM